jgi:LAO/AO transport system ATPase
VARAITLVENADPWDVEIPPAASPIHCIGVTGPPGSGKSTLVGRLIESYADTGRRVGVVAVDPSSPLSGGAVLGDRVRMGEHGSDDRVFIRSVASRGHLGGLSRQTSRIVDILDTAGFDTVVVETVGTGQSEVEVAGIADTRVVLCAPGLGDDVQAIKAGILEIADILVVNKGDSPLAPDTERALRDMLRLRRRGEWEVRVLRTTATTKEGTAALVDAIETHAAFVGRGRRLRAPPPVSADDRAAVDRALVSHRTPQPLLPTPVAREPWRRSSRRLARRSPPVAIRHGACTRSPGNRLSVWSRRCGQKRSTRRHRARRSRSSTPPPDRSGAGTGSIAGCTSRRCSRRRAHAGSRHTRAPRSRATTT